MPKRETIAGLPANEYYRQYREKRKSDPEWRARKVEQQRQYRLRNPRAFTKSDWNAYLKRTYGITADEYDVMVGERRGRCEVCGQVPAGKRDRLHVDHDHSTGVVRGLLCSACNVSLGHVKEDPARLRALADYIERHQ